jgi:hypothetical protein
MCDFCLVRGVFLRNGAHAVVSGNWIQGAGLSPFIVDPGFVGIETNAPFRHASITDNHLLGTAGRALYIAGTRNTISHNSIEIATAGDIPGNVNNITNNQYGASTTVLSITGQLCSIIDVAQSTLINNLIIKEAGNPRLVLDRSSGSPIRWNIEVGTSVAGNGLAIADLTNSIQKLSIQSGVTGKAVLNAPLNLFQVSQHANNAAAIAAGLVAGDVYRTGEVLKIVF